MAMPEPIRFRASGTAGLVLVGGLASLFVFLSIYAGVAHLRDPKMVEPSFLWGMPVFASLWVLAFLHLRRPVVIDYDESAHAVRVTRPRVWPLPPAVVRLPRDVILDAHVRTKRGGPDSGEEARLVLRMRGHADDVPISRWSSMAEGQFNRVAAEIGAFLAKIPATRP